jgi:outer membrane protein
LAARSVTVKAEAFRVFRAGTGWGKATRRQSVFRAGFFTMRTRFQIYLGQRAPMGDAVRIFLRGAVVLAVVAGASLRAQDPSSLGGSSPAPVPAASVPATPATPDAATDTFTSAIPAADTAKPKTRLTWEQCVRIALAHNPDLEVFRDNILNSDAVRRGAYSLLYPQISLSAAATRNYSGPGLGAPSVYSTEFSEQISLSQTIFNGFLTQGNISQARSQLALAFANLDSQKSLTSFDLKTAFAQVIYAQQDVAVARRVIEVNQNNTRLVKLLYDSGNEDKGAYLLSKAQLDQAIFMYNQAVRNVELSDQQLVVILGQDEPRPIEAIGVLKTAPLPIKPDFHALAVQTPAYFQHRAAADAAAAGITIAQSAFYPTLGFDVSAARNGSVFFPRQNGASAGFTVSYALFDGGANYFNVRAARASLLAALASLRSGTNDAELTLAQNFKGLVDAIENQRIQEELQDATELRYTIAEAQYRNGLIPFQDFTDITTAYVQQLQTTLGAQQASVNAEASWEQSRGQGAIP